METKEKTSVMNIRRCKLENSYLESKKDLLVKFQKAIVEGIKIPKVFMNQNENDIQVTHRNIITKLGEEFSGKVDILMNLPGICLQVLLTEENLIINILFGRNPENENESKIHLDLCSLEIYTRDEVEDTNDESSEYTSNQPE